MGEHKRVVALYEALKKRESYQGRWDEPWIVPHQSTTHPIALRPLLTLSAFLLLAGSLVAADPMDYTPASAKWKSRPVLILTADEASPRVQDQLKVFAEDPGAWQERDMVLLLLIVDADDPTKLLKAQMLPDQPVELSAGEAWLKVIGNQQLNAFAESSSALGVYLIGKDGGVKLARTDEKLASQELFKLIDSMPMRRNEMRGQ